MISGLNIFQLHQNIWRSTKSNIISHLLLFSHPLIISERAATCRPILRFVGRNITLDRIIACTAAPEQSTAFNFPTYKGLHIDFVANNPFNVHKKFVYLEGREWIPIKIQSKHALQDQDQVEDEVAVLVPIARIQK